jgi:trehalose/maltose hydrolase-like predicted phosphorylase
MLSLKTQPDSDLVKCNGGWLLMETGFVVENNRKYEGLFTLGSGYLHLRGSLEEHLLDAPQNLEYMRMPANVTAEEFPKTKSKWGTYVPGIYGKHPFLSNELINLPSFLGMRPAFNGCVIDLESKAVSDFTRSLDMQSAVLRHSYKWKPEGQSAQIEVNFERFVSAFHKSVVVQRLALHTDQDVSIDLESWIDGDVRTNGFDHFAESEFIANDAGHLSGVVKTDLADTVSIVSRHSLSQGWKAKNEKRAARAFMSCHLKAGVPFVIEKRSVVSTSRDVEQKPPAMILDGVADLTFDVLLEEHKRVWQSRWEKSDVQVEGHSDSQTALRASIYHLLRAQVTGDRRVAIDAKGYAGEGYFGRFFWDTEMYLHPFFAYTDIERARELAEFRIESLPGAKRNAHRFGYPGARFAWESDASGDECCMVWQYRDHEVHITADVVYALVHQALAAAEQLSDETKSVILESARYWKGRIDWRAGEQICPDLLGVMGPDEYAPLSANNAYTNRLVRFTFDLASKYGADAGGSPTECAEFFRLANLLPMPRRADGLLLQSDQFESLAEPNFAEHWLDRKRPYAAQVGQERLYRSKNLKQADVLMLMFLFPGEFSDAEVRQAWEYYVPVTTHDSSLSAGVHSMIASRLGLDVDAWNYWLKSAFLDLDLNTEAAAEGVHIAGNGANWMVAVCGFAGFRYAIQSDTLTLDPHLPKEWMRLAFPINWRGQQIFVDITSEKLELTNDSALPLEFYLSGRKHRLSAREKKDYSLRSPIQARVVNAI